MVEEIQKKLQNELDNFKTIQKGNEQRIILERRIKFVL